MICANKLQFEKAIIADSLAKYRFYLRRQQFNRT